MGASQRHWHSAEDEFVYVREGELTLIEDGGETLLRDGACAAFSKGSESCQIAWCYRVKIAGSAARIDHYSCCRLAAYCTICEEGAS